MTSRSDQVGVRPVEPCARGATLLIAAAAGVRLTGAAADRRDVTTTSTLPPPLSAPPSLGTLQGLLDGLQQPMVRGVPSPPTPVPVFEEAAAPVVRPTSLNRGAVLDLTRLEHLAAGRQVIESSMRGEAAAPDGVPAPTEAPDPAAPTVALTWSAGRAHHHRRTAAIAAAAAAVAAAATVTALVAAGELALP